MIKLLTGAQEVMKQVRKNWKLSVWSSKEGREIKCESSGMSERIEKIFRCCERRNEKTQQKSVESNGMWERLGKKLDTQRECAR